MVDIECFWVVAPPCSRVELRVRCGHVAVSPGLIKPDRCVKWDVKQHSKIERAGAFRRGTKNHKQRGRERRTVRHTVGQPRSIIQSGLASVQSTLCEPYPETILLWHDSAACSMRPDECDDVINVAHVSMHWIVY